MWHLAGSQRLAQAEALRREHVAMLRRVHGTVDSEDVATALSDSHGQSVVGGDLGVGSASVGIARRWRCFDTCAPPTPTPTPTLALLMVR
jgi:hypothetical protein